MLLAGANIKELCAELVLPRQYFARVFDQCQARWLVVGEDRTGGRGVGRRAGRA